MSGLAASALSLAGSWLLLAAGWLAAAALQSYIFTILISERADVVLVNTIRCTLALPRAAPDCEELRRHERWSQNRPRIAHFHLIPDPTPGGAMCAPKVANFYHTPLQVGKTSIYRNYPILLISGA